MVFPKWAVLEEMVFPNGQFWKKRFSIRARSGNSAALTGWFLKKLEHHIFKNGLIILEILLLCWGSFFPERQSNCFWKGEGCCHSQERNSNDDDAKYDAEKGGGLTWLI